MAAGAAGANLKGRLTMLANSEAAVKDAAFDGLGRVTAHVVVMAGLAQALAFGYEYNELAPAAVVYPSGRRVSYEYDVAGRAVSVSGLKDGQPASYVSGVSYAPHGGMAQMTLGSKVEQWCYNERLQPAAMRVGAGASAGCVEQAGDVLRLGYGYGTTNNIGNVLSQTIRRDGVTISTDSYGYDALNRLKTAAGSGWSQVYAYDRYGNRAVTAASTILYSAQTPTVGSDAESEVEAMFASNRWAGGVYDAGGNQTARYGGTFEYDGENRLRSATVNGVTTGYAYDGEGRRVKKGGTVYVYDAFGRLAAEYGGGAGAAGVQYLAADHLGSTRLVMDGTGGAVRCSDYLPFGEEIPQSYGNRPACYGAGDGPRMRFTGKERDGETGLDYFGARYMSAAQGRFTSPDAPFADQHTIDPQSWNLYSYTRNNPLAHVDVNGEFVATVTGALAGGLIGGAVEAYRGGSFWKGAASGAVSGAIAGSIIDTGGASLGVLAVAGAAGGVGGGVVGRALDGSGTSVGDVARDASVGAVAGAVGGKLGEVVVNKVAGMVVQRAANAAVDAVGPGSGAAYGTRVHSAMEGALNKSGVAKALNLNTEVSYSGGQVVSRGTPGSVRLDVVRGNPNNPGAVFDLKTGTAQLTPGRVTQIQQNLPRPVPVKEIRPEVP